jgi:hypothetical protein
LTSARGLLTSLFQGFLALLHLKECSLAGSQVVAIVVVAVGLSITIWEILRAGHSLTFHLLQGAGALLLFSCGAGIGRWVVVGRLIIRWLRAI